MTDMVSDALAYEQGAATTRILKTSEWTEPVNERYLVLFHEDHTHSEIAAKLNAEFGTKFTRNACLGRKNRLGLSRDSDRGTVKVKRQPAPPRDRTVRVRRGHAEPVVKRPVLICVALAPLNIPLLELTDDHCRFPCDDIMFYCGHPKKEGSSYCFAHFHECTQPLKPRTDPYFNRNGAAA